MKVAPYQDGEAWWSVVRPDRDQGHVTRGACCSLSSVPYPFHQFTTRLAICSERFRVRELLVQLPSITNITRSRYLYYQMFGIDACFWFKRRQVSNYEKDPELGPGFAYLVAWDSYSEYLHRFTNQEEVCPICPLFTILN